MGAAEAANGAAVKTKEATWDAHLKAFDDKVAKDLIEARKQRDLDAATAAKAAADANLAANDARVAWEKDQLEDRTRTDSSTSTRTPPPRPPRSKASTTRERELTADSSRPSPLSEHVID